jgi:hypothetical protein
MRGGPESGERDKTMTTTNDTSLPDRNTIAVALEEKLDDANLSDDCPLRIGGWTPSVFREFVDGSWGWRGALVEIDANGKTHHYYTARIYSTREESLRAIRDLESFLRGWPPPPEPR